MHSICPVLFLVTPLKSCVDARFFMLYHYSNMTYITSFFELQFLTPAHKGWGYSRSLRRPGAGAGIKLVGVPQPKPLHGFSPNF